MLELVSTADIMAWPVFAVWLFAASLYPVGLFFGTRCSKCCQGCADGTTKCGSGCCTIEQSCCGGPASGTCCDSVCCNGVCCDVGEFCINGICTSQCVFPPTPCLLEVEGLSPLQFSPAPGDLCNGIAQIAKQDSPCLVYQEQPWALSQGICWSSNNRDAFYLYKPNNPDLDGFPDNLRPSLTAFQIASALHADAAGYQFIDGLCPPLFGIFEPKPRTISASTRATAVAHLYAGIEPISVYLLCRVTLYTESFAPCGGGFFDPSIGNQRALCRYFLIELTAACKPTRLINCDGSQDRIVTIDLPAFTLEAKANEVTATLGNGEKLLGQQVFSDVREAGPVRPSSSFQGDEFSFGSGYTEGAMQYLKDTFVFSAKFMRSQFSTCYAIECNCATDVCFLVAEVQAYPDGPVVEWILCKSPPEQENTKEFSCTLDGEQFACVYKYEGTNELKNGIVIMVHRFTYERYAIPPDISGFPRERKVADLWCDKAGGVDGKDLWIMDFGVQCTKIDNDKDDPQYGFPGGYRYDAFIGEMQCGPACGNDGSDRERGDPVPLGRAVAVRRIEGFPIEDPSDPSLDCDRLLGGRLDVKLRQSLSC